MKRSFIPEYHVITNIVASALKISVAIGFATKSKNNRIRLWIIKNIS